MTRGADEEEEQHKQARRRMCVLQQVSLQSGQKNGCIA
jgi:hypothetical protein